MPNELSPIAGALTYAGTEIHQRHEMLSLTDMWRAAGSDPSRRPAEWARSEDATRFVSFLAETLNVGISHIDLFRSERGGNRPGTWAHWQIGLAYAKYLSPEFHVWCNTVVRERMEGRTSITLRDLDAHVRQVIGGIVKGIVAKALDERIEPIDGTDPVGFVISMNLRHWHLNESQRAVEDWTTGRVQMKSGRA